MSDIETALEETRVGRWRISTDALRAYSMVIALIAIWIFFQWRTRSDLYPYGLFLHPVNLANLLKQMSVTGVLAVGMLLVIVARQIDLSVGRSSAWPAESPRCLRATACCRRWRWRS